MFLRRKETYLLLGSNPATGSQPQDNTTLKNLLDRKPTPFQQQNWPYQVLLKRKRNVDYK